MGQPAILLDRDGVINVNRRDHVKCWDEFHFQPGVLPALLELTRLRMPIVVITNQAVVERGIISAAELDAIHQRMRAAIERVGARLDGIIYCPHDSHTQCGCRKPEPGMILEAASRFDLDLRRTVFVGDACTDVEAGRQAHCRTILVLTGRGVESARQLASLRSPLPDAVVEDLPHAVPLISRFVRGDVSLPSWPLQMPALLDAQVSAQSD